MIDVFFSTGTDFSFGELLSSLKRETHLGGLPKEEPQIPSSTLQEGSEPESKCLPHKKIELVLVGR